MRGNLKARGAAATVTWLKRQIPGEREVNSGPRKMRWSCFLRQFEGLIKVYSVDESA